MFLQPVLTKLLCLAALLGSGVDARAEPLAGPYPGAVERVVDGDTLDVRVAVWLDLDIRVLVRVRGIDAPELRGRCDLEKARAAKATVALARLVADGAVVLTNIEGDKYFGRVLADVSTSQGRDVATTLLAGGHVRPYDGRSRATWCEIGGLGDPAKVAQAGLP